MLPPPINNRPKVHSFRDLDDQDDTFLGENEIALPQHPHVRCTAADNGRTVLRRI